MGGVSDLDLADGINNALPSSSTTFKVCDDRQELRVVLAWIDRQTLTGTTFNDLNLTLISPSGIEYRGNYFTDDVNRSGVISATEDCGAIGAADPDQPNNAIEGTIFQPAEWSLPVCSNTRIQGQLLVENAFDDANVTEAIFLSPNPDGTFADTDPFSQVEPGDWILEVSSTGTVLGTQDYAVTVVGGVCLGSSVRFSRTAYSCNQKTRITVTEVEELGPFPDPAPSAMEVSDRTTVDVLDATGVVAGDPA